MRKIYVCPRCKHVHWKIGFEVDEGLHMMHCSQCGFHRDISLRFSPFSQDKFELDTIDMGLENTGEMTDQEKKNGCQ